MDPKVIIVGVVVFAVTLLVLSKLFGGKSGNYKKRSLADISRGEVQNFNDSELINEDRSEAMAEKTSGIPIIGAIARQIKVSGKAINLFVYLIFIALIAFIISYFVASAFMGNWLIGATVGIVVALAISNMYLNIIIERRNRDFLDNFPDAIDTIVRSVKAGQPLLTALRTIAQSGQPPLSREFQKVVDEVSYGRPLNEALYRMTDRIGLLDVNFFAVILSIQQETGGNLAEVLSNLSNVIRKRKQLRLKIKALTAEGRLTSTIFAVLPLIQIGAVVLVAEDYLDPLIETQVGNNIIMIAFAMIITAVLASRKMSNVKV